jgi:deoxyribodipyrimidine photo-lyase
MKKALFIFRRDLRLDDNTGLLFALKNADTVIPAFIFTPQQIEKNPYRSDHCLQFMIESLEDLEAQLKAKKGKLHLFFAPPEQVIAKCIKELGVDGVVVNRDYTPFSQQRDARIGSVCKKYKIPFHTFEDALLHPPEATLKSDGKPYTIFTPYFRNASKLPVPGPAANRHSNYFKQPIRFAKGSAFYKKILPKRAVQSRGGRKAALEILKKVQTFSAYAKERDFPAKEATSHLSPHLKFTTCSPREVYHSIKKRLGPHSPLIRSLYWRDFFTSIAFFFPYVFKGAFHKKFDKLPWNYDKKRFHRWCKGETGFPIVDAGMRELNATGFMHNRVRMIVASFLVKDLHIDWRWGEKYFAQTLLDYDPAVNNGNWQWAASTGCDAQPYFRIFNPWNQQKKYDPDCLYIKQWIPELADLSPKAIHEWQLTSHSKKIKYPAPLLDHAKEAKETLQSYKNCAK